MPLYVQVALYDPLPSYLWAFVDIASLERYRGLGDFPNWRKEISFIPATASGLWGASETKGCVLGAWWWMRLGLGLACGDPALAFARLHLRTNRGAKSSPQDAILITLD